MATGSNGTSRSTVPQRRYLTILFCDLVGYTELSEQLDPEDLRDLQLQYLGGCGINSRLENVIYQQMMSYRRPPQNLFTGSPETLDRLMARVSTI